MQEVLPLFSRPYGKRQLRSSGYHDQLNTWSDRVRIRSIKFKTTIVTNQRGQQMWEAAPIFPMIYLRPTPLHEAYAGYGQSMLIAQTESWHKLQAALWHEDDIKLVRWEFSRGQSGYKAIPFYYQPPALLEDPDVIGVGSSKSSAVEKSAKGLLLSEYYCVTW